MQEDSRFHIFTEDELARIELPTLFTFPFHYTPHELCKIASQHLIDYLTTREDLHDELQSGKMLGVLVVRHNNKKGYLAAYSGNLGHCSSHEHFVPAVCDLLSANSFFVPEENKISNINKLIDKELFNPHRLNAIQELKQCQEDAVKEIRLPYFNHLYISFDSLYSLCFREDVNPINRDK